MISGVIFDAFGTILRIDQRTNPYLQLFREGRRQGCSLGPEAIHQAMTMDLSLDDFAARLGIMLSPRSREELNRALQLELDSTTPYGDALKCIALLQGAGVQVGICSNLAAPFGRIVEELFPKMDGYAFSFKLGIMKPDPAIYHAVCSQMNVSPGHNFSAGQGRVLMIGDSQRCDRDAPRAIGIMGLHLDRTGRGRISDLAQFAQLVIDQIQQDHSAAWGESR